MKYLVLVGDGMADYPLDDLEGKTPLMVARTPNLDFLAQQGRLGLVCTIPKGCPKGSEIANLSIFGYDPTIYYTGRGPLEAASIGVQLGPDDVAFRCNLVTLEALGGTVIMRDYSAGHISAAEGKEIILDLERELGDTTFRFYPGVSYRHLLVWHGGKEAMQTTPPHDITDHDIGDYLPRGEGSRDLIRLMTDAQILLKTHPANERRRQEGRREVSSIWPWGQGRAPRIPTFSQKFSLQGCVISAVDLIKGIGIYAGLQVVEVPGATGYLDTNYRGKAEYGLKALEETDFVYIHVEAPDEASHNGDLEAKIEAIERFDELIVGTVLQGVQQLEDSKIMVLPDHPTPIPLRTHADDPVPFVMYPWEQDCSSTVRSFDEKGAKESGIFVKDGHTLMERFIRGSC